MSVRKIIEKAVDKFVELLAKDGLSVVVFVCSKSAYMARYSADLEQLINMRDILQKTIDEVLEKRVEVALELKAREVAKNE